MHLQVICQSANRRWRPAESGSREDEAEAALLWLGRRGADADFSAREGTRKQRNNKKHIKKPQQQALQRAHDPRPQSRSGWLQRSLRGQQRGLLLCNSRVSSAAVSVAVEALMRPRQN